MSSAAANQDIIFATTDTKLYVPVVNQDSNAQLTGIKYHSQTETLNAPNPYLDFLIVPSFQGRNRLFVLPFNTLEQGTQGIIFKLQK